MIQFLRLRDFPFYASHFLLPPLPPPHRCPLYYYDQINLLQNHKVESPHSCCQDIFYSFIGSSSSVLEQRGILQCTSFLGILVLIIQFLQANLCTYMFILHTHTHIYISCFTFSFVFLINNFQNWFISHKITQTQSELFQNKMLSLLLSLERNKVFIDMLTDFCHR